MSLCVYVWKPFVEAKRDGVGNKIVSHHEKY